MFSATWRFNILSARSNDDGTRNCKAWIVNKRKYRARNVEHPLRTCAYRNAQIDHGRHFLACQIKQSLWNRSLLPCVMARRDSAHVIDRNLASLHAPLKYAYPVCPTKRRFIVIPCPMRLSQRFSLSVYSNRELRNAAPLRNPRPIRRLLKHFGKKRSAISARHGRKEDSHRRKSQSDKGQLVNDRSSPGCSPSASIGRCASVCRFSRQWRERSILLKPPGRVKPKGTGSEGELRRTRSPSWISSFLSDHLPRWASGCYFFNRYVAGSESSPFGF